MTARQPVIFVSHGAPTLALEPGPTRGFLAQLGAALPQPRAILVVSAHWETAAPAVSSTERPQTIHDFYGFPRELYEMRYPAPGAPQLAQQVRERLGGAGIAADAVPDRGLDHGAWVPLMLMYPQADIPVTQLSVQTALGPDHHLRLGEARRPRCPGRLPQAGPSCRAQSSDGGAPAAAVRGSRCGDAGAGVAPAPCGLYLRHHRHGRVAVRLTVMIRQTRRYERECRHA